MDAVAKKAGFASREAMIADMRTNPKYFAKTPEELMAAAALMAKTIDGKMPSLFTRLPRLPYGVRADPGRNRARATPPLITSRAARTPGIAGTYYVNTIQARPAAAVGDAGADGA